MADELNRPHSHISSFERGIQNLTTAPVEPLAGDTYYDTTQNKLFIYNGTAWKGASFSTTTSTSTSTTSTSTSTTSTSTSLTTSTSTSSSTSTSTTTTL